VTDRADAVNLRAQPYDAARGYQVQRIRTAEERESREAVRATPHPALSPWLATREGSGHARHDGSHKHIDISTYVHELMDEPLRQIPAAERGRELVRVPPSAPAASAPAGTARPWLPRHPAATDTARPSQEVRDRVDTSLVSDERAPDALEMTRPASPGDTRSSTGAGGLGYAPLAQGTAPVPTGAPDLPRGELRLSTYERQYDQYVSRVKQKVDPLWEFPRDLALRLEQGDLLVSFTIARDGRLKELHLIKRSGFPAFDKNVLSAIKKAAPFDPLPATLGSELRVTAPFAGGTPAIR
jgi:protein TonB